MLLNLSERSPAGTPWRSHASSGRCYEEDLLPLLAPTPVLSDEAATQPTEFVPPRMSIHCQGTYGPIEEMIPSDPKDQCFFLRKVVMAMARCIDTFRSQLVRMRNVASYRRDDTVREVAFPLYFCIFCISIFQPIPSRTRTRPEVRRKLARSSSRRHRTTSGGRGGRSNAARTEAVEGSVYSSESAQVGPMGQGEATSASFYLLKEHFVIPPGAEYDNQALKRANKCWRQYKYSLKRQYYKPEQKTLDQICNNVPHGITSSNWVKLVKYWDSDKGKDMSECGKKARASQDQFHTSGSKSFAKRQADYEDEHGKKMSLLELWIKTHTGKDESFLPNTVTEYFVDDVKAKVEELRMMHPKMSEQELEDEAFQQTMYGNEIPDRPVGYGLEVKKGDIFGVRGVLRKEGYGKVQKRNIVMDSVKEEVNALHKKNDTLSQENEKMKDRVGHNSLLLKALVGNFLRL
ncbi:uncharacterized protein LOC110683296 [Chenopodium quinoa]|nr:uncharacterized protein LOC110683296 [Chenopodium quinoa]